MDPAAVWRERGIRDAVLGGDTAAWREWYDEHYTKLSAYIRWRCGGLVDLAEDVNQDTWLIAIRRLRRFDPARSPFEAWVRGVANNVIRNALRSRKRHSRRSRPLDSAVDPESPTATDCRQAERVAEVLSAISPVHEEVLRAKYLERMSVDQIATSLGTTGKAIESRLTRARQAFRELYEASS
jgi:RNA polymerase sigma-70 factor (ECF subfamily)